MYLIKAYLPLLLVGCLTHLAFAPYHWSLISLLSLALLFASVQNAAIRIAFYKAYTFAFGFFAFGVPWIFTSLHDFGEIELIPAFLATALFITFLSLFPAGAVALYRWLKPEKNWQILVFATCWLFFEWIKSWVLTGFPWLSMGYTQSETPLKWLFPIGGIWLVSWVWLILAVAVSKGLTRQLNRIEIGQLSALVLLLLGLNHIQPSSQIKGQPIQVALLQGNYNQTIKWDPEWIPVELDWYAETSFEHPDPSYIIWPETAIPALDRQVPRYLQRLNEWAHENNSYIITGIIQTEDERFYNALIGLGDISGQYQKKHLVPLGEYFPFRWMLALLPGLDIPMDDLSSGPDKQALFTTDQHQIAASICYEDVFGMQIRETASKADFLINVSNDAWFGDIAPWQHLQIAQMRALETGRYLVRGTNTGISAIINQHGELTHHSQLNEQTVIQGQVQAYTGETWYIRWGDYPMLGLMCLILILSLKYQVGLSSSAKA